MWGSSVQEVLLYKSVLFFFFFVAVGGTLAWSEIK